MVRAVAIVLGLSAALAAASLGAGAEAGSSAKLRPCSVRTGFTAGPFFVDNVRARGVSCRAARRLIKRWGRTSDCIMPSGPSDRVCRTGGYRCVNRDVPNFEGARARCRNGKSKAVGFRFGS